MKEAHVSGGVGQILGYSNATSRRHHEVKLAGIGPNSAQNDTQLVSSL
jgi:hypothetical protein